MKFIKTFCLASLLVGVAFAAQAATLTDIVGDIKVSGGGGFKAVKSSVNVNPGDKIMAAQGASARIVYGDKLAVLVKSGQLRVVPTEKMVRIRGGAAALAGDRACRERGECGQGFRRSGSLKDTPQGRSGSHGGSGAGAGGAGAGLAAGGLASWVPVVAVVGVAGIAAAIALSKTDSDKAVSSQ